MKVMSLSFVLPLSLFSFVVLLPHRSLQPLTVLLLLSFCSLLPHTVAFCCIKASHTHWNITVRGFGVCVCLLLLLSNLRFLSFLFHLSPLSCLMQYGKSPSACLSFCLPPPSLFLLSSPLVFLCFCVDTTTRSLPFFPASLSFLTTAHSRCDEFFANHFPICSSTSDSRSWYLLVLEGSTLTWSYHNLASVF